MRLIYPLYNFSLTFTDINECVSLPCQNEGTCVDLVNGYRCSCMAGYTETNCQTSWFCSYLILYLTLSLQYMVHIIIL